MWSNVSPALRNHTCLWALKWLNVTVITRSLTAWQCPATQRGVSAGEIFVMPLIHRHPPSPVTATERQPGQLLQGTAESCGMEGCWQVKRSPLTPPLRQSSPNWHCKQQAASQSRGKKYDMRKTLMETGVNMIFDTIYCLHFFCNSHSMYLHSVQFSIWYFSSIPTRDSQGAMQLVIQQLLFKWLTTSLFTVYFPNAISELY